LAFLPSILANVALKAGGAAALRKAKIVQYSSTNAPDLALRADDEGQAMDWTRPAQTLADLLHRALMR